MLWRLLQQSCGTQSNTEATLRFMEFCTDKVQRACDDAYAALQRETRCEKPFVGVDEKARFPMLKYRMELRGDVKFGDVKRDLNSLGHLVYTVPYCVSTYDDSSKVKKSFATSNTAAKQ